MHLLPSLPSFSDSIRKSSILLKVNTESSVSTYFQNWLSSNMTLSSKREWCFCSPTDPWLKGFLAVQFPLLYKNSTFSILTNLSKLFWVFWSIFLFLSAIYTNVTNLIGILGHWYILWLSLIMSLIIFCLIKIIFKQFAN